MLLQKVDTFEKAINVLLSEEQANSDTRQCSGSEPKDADVFATSAYKKDQKSEHQNVNTSKSTPRSDYSCYRCNTVGHHYQNECPHIDKKCYKCDAVGHLSSTCKRQSNSRNSVPSGRANAIRAHIETLSPNQVAVFNAGQIEKAEHCGLVYNVETNDVEEPENMNRHQKFAMFGHLN